MFRKDSDKSQAVSWAGTTPTIVEAGLTQLSNVIDVGEDVFGVVFTFLLTFNVNAVNGATIRVYAVDPEGNVSDSPNALYSIIKVTGARKDMSTLLPLGHQRFKVEITNDDVAQNITVMSATYVRVAQK